MKLIREPNRKIKEGATNLSARLRVTHTVFCRMLSQQTSKASSLIAAKEASQNVEEVFTNLINTKFRC